MHIPCSILEAVGEFIPLTSAKACLTTVAIRIEICDPDRHQNVIACSMAHCQPSLKISCQSVKKFLCSVSNRQTNRDDYVSSLAEVTNAGPRPLVPLIHFPLSLTSNAFQWMPCKIVSLDEQHECSPIPRSCTG